MIVRKCGRLSQSTLHLSVACPHLVLPSPDIKEEEEQYRRARAAFDRINAALSSSKSLETVGGRQAWADLFSAVLTLYIFSSFRSWTRKSQPSNRIS